MTGGWEGRARTNHGRLGQSVERDQAAEAADGKFEITLHRVDPCFVDPNSKTMHHVSLQTEQRCVTCVSLALKTRVK